MSKSKQSELQERVDAVIHLMMVGTRSSQIVRTLSGHYKVSERTVKRYIREAKIRLQFNWEDASDDYQLDLWRLEFIYSQALEKGNLGAAARALDAKHTIRQAYLKHQAQLRHESAEDDLTFLEESYDDEPEANGQAS